MNIGIIGVGRWGKKLLSKFDKIAEVKICACSNKSKNLYWFKNNYPNMILTDNYKDILYNDSIDAVVIATPNNTHYEIVKDSIRAKKHVFVEKPVTTAYKDVVELINLNPKQIVFINHIFLFHPCFIFLKKELSEKKIKSIKMIWNKFGTFSEDLFYNLLTHEISILGKLISFNFRDINIIKNRDIVKQSDDLQANFKLNDIFCEIHIDRYYPINEKRISIETSNGLIYHWFNDLVYLVDTKEKTKEIIFKSSADVLDISCRYFIDSIQNKIKKSSSSLEFGADVIGKIEKFKYLYKTNYGN